MKRHPEVNDINQEINYTDEEEEKEGSFSNKQKKGLESLSESEESFKDTSEE